MECMSGMGTGKGQALLGFPRQMTPKIMLCWAFAYASSVAMSMQEVVDDPGGNKMLLVMDYMEGGPVLTREGLERGRRIPEALSLQYFRDMCKVWLSPPLKKHHVSPCVLIRNGSFNLQ